MAAKRRPILNADPLVYAERGWRVFPANEEKKPRVKWSEQATTDREQISLWQAEFPNTNWAIATGRDSNLLVIDADVKGGRDGIAELKKLEKIYGSLPPTSSAESPHGRHFYFRCPGTEIRNSAGRLGRGVDVRADGGYIMAPPSIVDGRSYRWLNNREPTVLPESWVLALMARPPRAGGVSGMVEQGTRNDTVFGESCRLRRLNTDRAEATCLIHQFNRSRCQPPLSDAEVERCVESAWRYPPRYSLNDLGNAQRFVDGAEERVRYVIERRQFIVWSGVRWTYDTDALLTTGLMKASNRRMWDEVRDSDDDVDRKQRARFALAAQNTNRLKAAVDSVKTERGIAIRLAELDTDPYLLGVRNGTVDLRTSMFRPGQPEDFITKSGGCDYVEGATCSRWLTFIDEITGGDKDLAAFLQRYLGYAATGLPPEGFAFGYGVGANGKTVFFEIGKELFGDYAVTMRTESLMGRYRSRGGPSEDEARLAGARFVTANETEEGMRLNEALVKDLTGGDSITARYLYENPFEFKPTGKLFIRGNRKPVFSGDDEAMQRRVTLIPFAVTIPETKRDPKLRDKLRAELSGILNWVIEGCNEYLRGGLQVPESVRRATNEYISEMDSVRRFIDERCIVGVAEEAEPTLLHDTYRRWCVGHGVAPLTVPGFAKALKKRGFKPTRGRRGGPVVRRWKGVGLRRRKKARGLWL